jgi:hypothetical protein
MRISEDLHTEQWRRGDSPGKRAFEFPSKCVHDCVAAGKFPQLDPEIASQTFWAGSHGIALLLMMHYDLPPVV